MLPLEISFWACVSLAFTTYVGFPLLVWLRGQLFPRPVKHGNRLPDVSLIVCCYNEEGAIGAKLDNLLALDYPQEKLQILIASDGSSDRTEEIVEGYGHAQIQLLKLPRGGKAVALNAAAELAQHEILVFSDANSMYAADAIRKLVSGFADESVGGVAGNQVYLKKPSAAATEAGERSYWSFDRRLKMWQSRAGNVISATGAIYAIRRSLFRPVPDGVTDDFVTSTRVIEQGYRLIFAPDAVCYEPVAQAANKEFGRKTRITTRGLRGVLTMRALLNPFRFGFYAIQLWFHKVLRRLIVFPLLACCLIAPQLWSVSIVYQCATSAGALLFGLAACGWILNRAGKRLPKPVALPYFFCMVNLAVLVAVFNILRGQRITIWNTQRPGAKNPVVLRSDNPSALKAGSS